MKKIKLDLFPDHPCLRCDCPLTPRTCLQKRRNPMVYWRPARQQVQ